MTISEGLSTPDTASQVDWQRVYETALEIEEQEPGTACTKQAHYVRDHRHPVPYRVGYCHNMGQPTEHWHPNEPTHYACPDRQMKQCADD